MELGIVEQLTHSTVRIECTLESGQQSSGTGFFFGFPVGNDSIPLLVSNKHVVKGAKLGRLFFTLSTLDSPPTPDRGNLYPFVLDNFESAWLPHPDPDIDLAVMPLSGALHQVKQQSGRDTFFIKLSPQHIASTDERQAYSTMEDVVMIGYPNGIWDQVNNMPVLRKGITATHVGTRWNGRDEFLIDVATFPGSSGSPVFLIDIGSYRDAQGNTYFGKHRVKLLGINHSVMLHRADGVIHMVDTPTAMQPVPVTGIPNNLGVAVNSQRLLDFEPLLLNLQKQLEQRLQRPSSGPYPRRVF